MFKRKQKYFVGVAGKFFKLVANALPVPVATAATAVSGTSFVANWDPYDGADTYYLDVSISPTFSSFVIQQQPVLAPDTFYIVTGLTPCTTYYYRVRAEGLVPSPLSAPTLTPSGTQSTGTVISILSTGVWLNQGATFQYRWTRDGIPILGQTSNAYTIQAIDDGTVIRCEVLNTNNFGSSTWVPTSNSVNAVNFDVNAAVYISVLETAGATLSPTQKTAINNLFLDLKGQGPNNNTVDFWSTNKVRRWWPLVGGNSSANQVDVRLNLGTWAGGWTHNANGAIGNGSNTGFNSGITFSGEATSNWGFGYYVDNFVFNSNEWFSGYIRYSPFTISASRTFNTSPVNTGAYYVRGSGGTVNDNQRGSRGAIRIAGDVSTFINGSNVATQAATDDQEETVFTFIFGGILNAQVFPAGIFGSPVVDYRSMYITYGISISEAILLQQIDNAFQTALGRNTY